MNHHLNSHWAPMETLHPVPCERRTVFSVAGWSGGQTIRLAVDRLSPTETCSSDRQEPDASLSPKELRILAVLILVRGLSTIAARAKRRLRPLLQKKLKDGR